MGLPDSPTKVADGSRWSSRCSMPRTAPAYAPSSIAASSPLRLVSSHTCGEARFVCKKSQRSAERRDSHRESSADSHTQRRPRKAVEGRGRARKGVEGRGRPRKGAEGRGRAREGSHLEQVLVEGVGAAVDGELRAAEEARVEAAMRGPLQDPRQRARRAAQPRHRARVHAQLGALVDAVADAAAVAVRTRAGAALRLWNGLWNGRRRRPPRTTRVEDGHEPRELELHRADLGQDRAGRPRVLAAVARLHIELRRRQARQRPLGKGRQERARRLERLG